MASTSSAEPGEREDEVGEEDSGGSEDETEAEEVAPQGFIIPYDIVPCDTLIPYTAQ